MSWFGPISASHAADRTDTVFLVLVLFSALVVLLVGTLVTVFAIRFRRGSPAARGKVPALVGKEIEIGWTAAVSFLAFFLFWYAAAANFSSLTVAPNALELHIEAKQWMWKSQHPSGAREINALHVPVGQPVRLTMVSADVIHSFYIPALRIKQDVVPGQLTTIDFVFDRPGVYPLRCAEYCGTNHSRMTGEVVALPAEAYGAWLAGQPAGNNLAAEGGALFVSLGCSLCHAQNAQVSAPKLEGLYGRNVALADGRTVVVDEAFIREAILAPRKNAPAGYTPVMPSFAGRVRGPELLRLTAYIKSLTTSETAP